MLFSQQGRRYSPDILIPYSYAYDAPSLREATARIGFLGRVLAAFRIERLVLYRDREGAEYRRNALLVKEILDYLCTAPYLRKRIYGLKPSLRYAGLLPPLNLPTHPAVDDIRTEGIHYRQALVIASGETSVLDAGLRRDIRIRRRMGVGARVVLRVEVGGGRHGFKLVHRPTEAYNGFDTLIEGGLREALGKYRLRIATSRYGVNVAEVLPKLTQQIRAAGRSCIVFGAADRGLREIVEEAGCRMEDLFQMVVNVVPGQGLRTVRTEEALAYTLAILNAFLD